MLEVGPCPTEDVLRWSKFARRILAELRTTSEAGRLVSNDVVDLWSQTLDDWSATAQAASAEPDRPFRWTGELEPEVAEFLLDGLDRCLHSPTVMSWVTPAEAEEQRAFTTLVVRAFVDGLSAEGRSCRHFADQIHVSLGNLLDD